MTRRKEITRPLKQYHLLSVVTWLMDLCEGGHGLTQGNLLLYPAYELLLKCPLPSDSSKVCSLWLLAMQVSKSNS